MSPKSAVKKVAPVHVRTKFLLGLPAGSELLDVGCGNHSPQVTKGLNPGIRYYGLDIKNDEYEMDAHDQGAAEEIHFVDPDAFPEGIRHWGENRFDFMVASHVIEHVFDRPATIEAMASALKVGGTLYMAFPHANTVNFPSRAGSLNFFDDSTHSPDGPPKVEEILWTARQFGFRAVSVKNPYRPLVRRYAGLLQEPSSRRQRKSLSGTWAWWGFETVIFLEKGADAPTSL